MPSNLDSRGLTQAALGAVATLEEEVGFDVNAAIQSNDPAAIYAVDFLRRVSMLQVAQFGAVRSRLRNHFGAGMSISSWDAAIREERAKVALCVPTFKDFRASLIVNENGAPRALLANAITALRESVEWQGVLAYDEFAVRTLKLRPAPWPDSISGWWEEQDDTAAANWFQHNGIHVSVDVAAKAAELVARDHACHPVRDWLRTLQWDGVPRIGKLLPAYFGSEDTPYAGAIGSKWLISAVARVMAPGCQVDHCLILEGQQGIRKSTALRILGGKWFTDDVDDIGSKDSIMQIHGVWIVEISELDAMRRSEVSRVKAFLTRRIDHFRPPYGRRTADFPRQCIFAGSTNQSTYLNDETGARRFWPVDCTEIDLEALERDRDQLWAEAVVRYDDGVSWWIEDRGLITASREEQDARMERDPWDQIVWAWVLEKEKAWVEEEGYRATSRGRAPDPYSVAPEEILDQCLHRKADLWTQTDKNRVSRVLKSHGLKRFQLRVRDDDGRAVLGPNGLQEREWRYRRPWGVDPAVPAGLRQGTDPGGTDPLPPAMA